jgi:excisionase family DNA binding protein
MRTDRLFRAREVAALLDCSPQRVYQMVRDQILPTVRFGRSLRFRAEALEEWLKGGGRGHAEGWRRGSEGSRPAGKGPQPRPGGSP